jgi:hypothetical protein
MAPEPLNAESFPRDTLDFLQALQRHHVRHMIVGGEAVIYYGYARVTGDIDFFYDRSEDNVVQLFEALRDFWQGSVPGVAGPIELTQPGTIIQFGVPPNRIDLINQISGVEFSEAWPNRLAVNVTAAGSDIVVPYIGLRDLILNKQASARPKDLDDLLFLERKAL